MNSNITVLAVLSAIIFSAINCSGQEVIPKATITIAKKRAQNDWKAMRLKGTVKFILTAEVDKESSKLDTSKLINYEYRAFDTAGFIMEMKKSSVCDPCPNNRDFLKSIFKYNSSGFKTIQIDYLQNNKVSDTISFFWGENGMEEYLNGASYAHYKSASYKYDNEDRIIEYDSYDNSGKMLQRHLYKYNKQGKVQECDVYYTGFKGIEKHFDRYSNNLIIEEIRSSNETTIDRYDTNRILIQSNTGKDIITYDYKYDNYGNWITQKEYFNKKLSRITRREIEYY